MRLSGTGIGKGTARGRDETGLGAWSPYGHLEASKTGLIQIALWLLGMLLVFSGAVASAVFAPITLVPDSSASKECMLGYRAHCSFVPVSTITLVILALSLGLISLRMWRARPFGF